jgi:hypothetical protein
MKINKEKTIEQINKYSRCYDRSSYSIEANIIYKNKLGYIITNENEDYHLYLTFCSQKYSVYPVIRVKGKYIPDFDQKMDFVKLNFAIAKLFSELEKKKIKLFILDMRSRLDNQDIDSIMFVESIMTAANVAYGINAYKEKNNFIFEVSDSKLEIKKHNIGNKRVYKVFINNIFMYEYYEFVEAIEVSFLNFISNQFKKQGSKEYNKGRFKIKNTLKFNQE